MKVAINRTPKKGPWGGGNHFVRSFFESAIKNNHNVVSNLADPDIDLIFLMDPRPDSGTFGINDSISYKNSRGSTKIIQRINECDARKNTEHMDTMLLQCSQYNDHTVFVSNWMKEYFMKKGWASKSSSIVYNGTSKECLSIRKKSVVPKPSERKLKIVTHHWSNNILKGFDVYDFIDYLCGKRDDIEFTYVGRDRGAFKNTNVIKPLSGLALAKELVRHDIYVSGSRFDPGPNHILEALALGLPTYVHANGGGAVEFCLQGPEDKSKVFNNFTDLEAIIDTDIHYQNRMHPNDWDQSMKTLWETLSKLSLHF